MKTMNSGHARRLWPPLVWLLAIGCSMTVEWRLSAQAAATTESNKEGKSTADQKTDAANTAADDTDYNNWIELGVGSYFVSGDKAQFQRRQNMPGGPFGGVEDFHFEQSINKKGLFQIDGRGIFDNHDYSLKLDLSHPDIGYLRAGYREFRTWYDGSGGYSPRSNAWVSLYHDDLHMDRGDAFVEAGLTLPDWPVLTLRYDYQFRNGAKDSTILGDYNLNIGTANPAVLRSIAPTFLGIDERRHILQGDLKHAIGNTDFGVGLRYELSRNDDTRNIHRRPGELPPVSTPGTDRYVTQKDGIDTDMLNVHAFTQTRINDEVLFTTGGSFTTLDTDISGSRIYGSDYDPMYDPVYARRQFHDEGFLDLAGGAGTKQYVANLNLMYTPCDNFTIVPSVRIEEQNQDGVARFTETTVGAGPSFTSTQTPLENNRHYDFLDVSERLEARYTGVTNWVFYLRGEWLEGSGSLREKQRDTDPDSPAVDIRRSTDSERFTQKYTIGLNWYPCRQANLAAQYYHKMRANDYDHLVDDTSNAVTNGNRYPAFITAQNFDTDDVNFRVTLRPYSTVTMVSRYDFQLSTIDMKAPFLNEVQSGKSITHIFAESISWIPLPRWFLQGSINYVLDSLESPADASIGAAAKLVLQSKNNYWNASFLTGYALDEKTDIQAQYFYYRADNYVDNSAVSVPYGSGAEEHGVTATLIRQMSKRMRWTLRYGFFRSRDELYGGHNDYDAHMVFSSIQYRF